MGIATQNPELRKRFAGKPEYVENFMRFIAEELREYMARLGVKSVDELVGRTDLLKVKEDASDSDYSNLDYERILFDMSKVERKDSVFDPAKVYDFKLEETKDEKVLLKSAEIAESLKSGKKSHLTIEVSNIDRTFGTLLGAEITRLHPEGLEDDTITVTCNGSGGQSFGAFVPKGLTLEINGDSNDYFGKGLSGGKLIVHAPKEAKYDPSQNIIIGNVALYGATSGEAYIAGMAGERFCIRNSGATAVVEGVGEHGLEYMTGGCALILGPTGKNFAAGMSGGVAYVLDEENHLYRNLNKELVSMEALEKEDLDKIQSMLSKHLSATGSAKAKKILDHFDEYTSHFKKVIPGDYKRMMACIAKYEGQGLQKEEAKLEAFNEIIGH